MSCQFDAPVALLLQNIVCYPLGRILGKSQRKYECFGEEKNLFSCHETNPHITDIQSILVLMLTQLLRFQKIQQHTHFKVT